MSSYTEDDCQNPSCQILKPHAHIRGGVYFAWQRELESLRAHLAASQAEVERLTRERDGLKEKLDEADYGEAAVQFCKERDQAREERDESRANFKALHLIHGEITDERDEYLRQADKYHGLYKAAESVMGDRTKERDEALQMCKLVSEQSATIMHELVTEAARLREAAEKFRDFTGDGDNGPPDWMSEQWSEFDRTLKGEKK